MAKARSSSARRRRGSLVAPTLGAWDKGALGVPTAYGPSAGLYSPPEASLWDNTQGGDFSEVEDQRLHRPGSEGYPWPLRRTSGARARVVAPPRRGTGPGKALAASWSPSFHLPGGVLVCVRRRERKGVIHALGIAGRRNLRSPRRTRWSGISCKG